MKTTKEKKLKSLETGQIIGAQEFDNSFIEETRENKSRVEIDTDAMMTRNKGKVGEKEKNRMKRHKEGSTDALACEEKVENNVMISDYDKRPLEHQEGKKRKKQKRDDILNGYEDEKKMENRKMKKTDQLILSDERKTERKKGKVDAVKADDKEKKVEKKKKKEKKTMDDMMAGDTEKEVEKKKTKDDMLTGDTEKKAEENKMKDDMIAGDVEKKKKKKKKLKKTKDDMVSGDTEKTEEKKEKEKKTKDDTLAGDAEKTVEKKKTKDDTVAGDTEKTVQKKKKEKKTKDDTVAGDTEKTVEKKKKEKKTKDDTVAGDTEKTVERKKREKKIKDDMEKKVEGEEKDKKTMNGVIAGVIAGDEEKKKKGKRKENVEKSGYEVKDGKETIDAENLEVRRDCKKKRKLEEDRGGKANSEGRTTKNKAIAADSSVHLKPRSKKVRFSDDVEVFPPVDLEKKSNEKGDGLVRGKRFSKEEDEMIKKAVLDYIEVKNLGEEGLDMVLNCRSHPKIKNCWKEIGAALPRRPYVSVYYRAHTVFLRGERNWTPEELELVRQSHAKHGSNWKLIAQELGRFRVHVKDAWRRIKLTEEKRGNWCQDEYQELFELVNNDLQMKVFTEKFSKHGMLRDNISWEAISNKLNTRRMSACCDKWYKQLTSPMVAEGIWADADDYRLLMMLVELDASCEDEVDWDFLLEHRSGDVCRGRWKQMVNHLGEHGNKSFSEIVEVLSNRYCPDLLEVREAVDARPIVD